MNLLAERDGTVDRSTVDRRVLKFGPELIRPTEKRLHRASVDGRVVENTHPRRREVPLPLARHRRKRPDDRLPPHCGAGCEGGQGLPQEGDQACPSASACHELRLVRYQRSFRSLRTVKAALHGIERIGTIKRGHIHHKQLDVFGEIAFIGGLFGATA